MTETYCTKSCADCTQKEALQCPGCKAGPGQQYGSTCEIAQCCRRKCHTSCATCNASGTCGTFRGRHRMPEYRQKKLAAEAERNAMIAEKAPLLGRWLMLLFLLVIPSTIASFMTNETITEFLPALYIPGQILTTVCNLLYGLILLRLRFEDDHYHTAGVCSLLAAATSAVSAVLIEVAAVAGFGLFISVIAAVISLVGEYQEYMAHAAVVNMIDCELSEKWEKLWKWYIGTFAGMLGSLLVMLIIPVLGLLAILAACIGLLVTGILKLVYLYQTANIFRNYDPE